MLMNQLKIEMYKYKKLYNYLKKKWNFQELQEQKINYKKKFVKHQKM